MSLDIINTSDALRVEVDRLRRERDALAADAARYRFLRDNVLHMPFMITHEMPDGGYVFFKPAIWGTPLSWSEESKDAAIDAALSAKWE